MTDSDKSKPVYDGTISLRYRPQLCCCIIKWMMKSMYEMNEWIDVFCGKEGRDSDKLLAVMCCIVNAEIVCDEVWLYEHARNK